MKNLLWILIVMLPLVVQANCIDEHDILIEVLKCMEKKQNDQQQEIEKLKQKNTDPNQLNHLFLEKSLLLSQRNVHGGVTFDKPYWQDSIIIGGNNYKKGVGIHPKSAGVNSEAIFKIPKGYNVFRADIGLAGQTGVTCKGNAKVNIYIDDILRKTVELNGEAGVAKPVKIAGRDLPIPIGSKQLVIQSTTDDENICDHVFLGDARFDN